MRPQQHSKNIFYTIFARSCDIAASCQVDLAVVSLVRPILEDNKCVWRLMQSTDSIMMPNPLFMFFTFPRHRKGGTWLHERREKAECRIDVKFPDSVTGERVGTKGADDDNDSTSDS